MPGLALVSAPKSCSYPYLYSRGIGGWGKKKGSVEGHVSLDSDQSGSVMGGWFVCFLIHVRGL